jgi:multicomponent K+:H+ antiporter subunit G
MNAMGALPGWAAIVTGMLVLLGALLTLVGALGLLRFENFYRRVHAPTLGTTLGAGSILIGSMVFFTVLQSRPVVHEMLITVFLTVTTPVTLMFLVRAAFARDRQEGNALVSGVPQARPPGPGSDGPDRVTGP